MFVKNYVMKTKEKAMKTAVEWLQQEVILQTNLPLNLENVLVFNKLIEQAKEMEKEQLIDFHIEVMKKGLKYEKEKEWSDEYLPLIKERAEQHYNEIRYSILGKS